MDKDNKLSLAEFRVMIHLIYWVLKGEQLPLVLPPTLIQQAKTVPPAAAVPPQTNNSAPSVPNQVATCTSSKLMTVAHWHSGNSIPNRYLHAKLQSVCIINLPTSLCPTHSPILFHLCSNTQLQQWFINGRIFQCCPHKWLGFHSCSSSSQL